MYAPDHVADLSTAFGGNGISSCPDFSWSAPCHMKDAFLIIVGMEISPPLIERLLNRKHEGLVTGLA